MSITMCGCRGAVMGISFKFAKAMLFIIKFIRIPEMAVIPQTSGDSLQVS